MSGSLPEGLGILEEEDAFARLPCCLRWQWFVQSMAWLGEGIKQSDQEQKQHGCAGDWPTVGHQGTFEVGAAGVRLVKTRSRRTFCALCRSSFS